MSTLDGFGKIRPNAQDSTPAVPVQNLLTQAALSRQMTFPNQRTEVAYISDFDHRLTQTVRKTEGLLLDQARDMSAQLDELVTAAEEATRILREMELDLRDDGDVDLDAWSATDAAMGRISALAARYPARIEVLSERLEDPLGYAVELQERFPALYRPQLLPTVTADV